MGYRTFLSGHLYGEEEKIKRCESCLNDKLGKEIFESIFDTQDAYIKWWYIEDEIASVAKANPDVLIQIHGDGDESGDVWEKRWKGDKYEEQYVAIPPFTKPELQIPD